MKVSKLLFVGSMLSLGALIGVACCFFFSCEQVAARSLERAQIPQLDIVNVSLVDVAQYLKFQLAKQGVKCDVIVDHRISQRLLPRLMIGQGNGILWIHGVLRSFGCTFAIIEGNRIIFIQSDAQRGVDRV